MKETVQWELVSDLAVLNYLQNHPLIAERTECVQKVREAILYTSLDLQERIEYWKKAKRDKPSRWPKILIIRSYEDPVIYSFNFATKVWSQLCKCPTLTVGSEIVANRNSLYVIGGVQSSRVDKFNLEEKAWNPARDLNVARVSHAVTRGAEGKIFVIGGTAKSNDGFGPGLNNMEVYDETSDTWTQTCTMENNRSYLGAANVGGDNKKILAIGGCLTENCSSVECYENGKWKRLSNTCEKRDFSRLTTLDGEVFVVGGYNSSKKKYLSSVESFNVAKNKWTKGQPMQFARRSLGFVSHNGYLIAIGGMGKSNDLNSMEILDPCFNEGWKKWQYDLPEVSGKKIQLELLLLAENLLSFCIQVGCQLLLPICL